MEKMERKIHIINRVNEKWGITNLFYHHSSKVQQKKKSAPLNNVPHVPEKVGLKNADKFGAI